ncbi:MAG: glycosyltransferase [Caldilinea sp.]|nr:glycosyltransferase [Caldilinea sp.]MCW5841166.1 glycosyltransferase [Caldilinea sp.]
MTVQIALGYGWYAAAAAYHFERAFQELDCTVSYIGLPAPQRAGYSGTSSLVAVTESLHARPDFYLWIDSPFGYFPAEIELLSIPTACYLIDVHLGHWREAAARFFDVVFVAQKDYVSILRRIVGHDQVYWLPLAAALDVHGDRNLDRIYDVGFVGNIAHAHRKTARQRRLALLAARFNTNDFYRQYTPPQVGEVYSQSRIVFNTSIAGDVTMRIFEGTAAGALVLTDPVQNGFAELFELGAEVVVYQDDDDLLAKVHYYLEHPQEREAIARAGQTRTLAQHTYRHRVEQILEIMSAPTLRQLAPMRKASADERRAARRTVYTHLHMLDALFDEEKAADVHPLLRFWHALPCLARRVLR